MMKTLKLLTTRRSCKKLKAPAPNKQQLTHILQAATQVPDHGDLTPWRFVVIDSKKGKKRFHDVLQDTVTDLKLGKSAAKKAKKISTMSPMTIAVIFTPKKGKPEWEQQLSAGCAAYAIQLAAKAQDFDSFWISGMWVNSPLLRKACDCGERDKIIGLIMLGTAKSPRHKPKNTKLSKFVTHW